jgi:NADP-dependent 3-hydroxy acid dehydrogenase YdfG
MLKGKIAFITGASAGIGAAVARALSAEGVKLGLASRRGSDLELDDAVGLTCDVRDFGAVEAAVDETVSRFGGLDIVVANAGVGSYHAFGEEPLEHVEEMIDVNLKGTISAIRAALPHLKRGVATDFALADGYGRPEDALEGMMTADDIAEVVVFVLTRPRGMRILESAFRPMKEASWG